MNSQILKTCLKCEVSQKKEGRVRFSPACSIVLIPLSIEYAEAGISLWWTKRDLQSFRNGDTEEKIQQLEKIVGSTILIVSEDSGRKTSLASQLAPLVDSKVSFKGCKPSEVKNVLKRLKYPFAAVVVDCQLGVCSDLVREIGEICPSATHVGIYAGSADTNMESAIREVNIDDINTFSHITDAIIVSATSMTKLDHCIKSPPQPMRKHLVAAPRRRHLVTASH
jgi:hypothetical protein